MKIKIIITIIVFVLSVNESLAQWIPTGGPNTGAAYSVYYNSGILYTGLNGLPFGIYFSSDSGARWTKMGDSFGDVHSMLKAGNVFYACGRLNGPVVYRTTNNGANWTSTNVGSVNNNMRQLANLGADIFVSSDEGVFKSTNAGLNWTQVYSAGIIHSLVTAGPNLIAIGAATYISTNAGANWTQTSSFTGQRLYNGGSDYVYGQLNIPPYGVIVSTNGGFNWTNHTSGFPPNQRPFDFTSIGNTVYSTIFPNLVYKSTDNGQSWSTAGTVPGNTFIQRLATDGTNLFTCYPGVSSESGIFKSTNSGVNWFQTGLPLADIGALASNTNSIYFLNGSFFGRSDDNGTTWMQTASFGGAGVKIFLNNNDIFVCTNAELTRSTNNGNNFTPSINEQTYDIINLSGTLFATNFSQVRTSSDGGNNWNTIPALTNKRVGRMAAINNYFLAGSRAVVDSSYYSTNGGVTWNAITDDAFRGITAIHVLGNTVYAKNHSEIIKSTNNGLNWISASSGITGNPIIYKIMSFNNTLIAASSLGLFTSSNAGANWITFNQGLPPSNGVFDITSKGTFIYAGVSASSVWKRDLSQLGIQIISAEIPNSFSLHQNYPNPFNPMTKIKFDIPKAFNTKLAVYDILGKEIAVLVNENLKAGSYEVDFSAADLPSGAYFYRITTEGFTETKKMMLLK